MSQVDVAPKLQAAQDFVVRLLEAPAGRNVARVLLFGSVARGEGDARSDVDLLVFAHGDLEAVSEVCADVAFELGLETGESLEPLVLPVGEMWVPGSYFVHLALKEGKELYAMPEEELRRLEAIHKLELAREFLDGARANFEEGRYRIALDAGYNAAELCVKALLLIGGVPLPTTHGGLVSKFGEEYVQKGLAPREVGRLLHRALELRNRARYVAESSVTRAETVLTLASRLTELLEKTL